MDFGEKVYTPGVWGIILEKKNNISRCYHAWPQRNFIFYEMFRHVGVCKAWTLTNIYLYLQNPHWNGWVISQKSYGPTELQELSTFNESRNQIVQT